VLDSPRWSVGFCGHKTPRAFGWVTIFDKLSEILCKLAWSAKVVHTPNDCHVTQAITKCKHVLSPIRVTSMIIPDYVSTIEYKMLDIICFSPRRAYQEVM
jgi:hypothetical protein